MTTPHLFRVLAVPLLALTAPTLHAQQPADAPAAAAKPAACPIKRSVLANGDLQVQNADCSVKIFPKKDVALPPQETPSAKADSHPAADRQAPARAAQLEKLREIKPEPLPDGELDPQLRANYLRSMNGYFDYYAAGYIHRQRVFEWQLISSVIIFILVVILVGSGVYFAALQFHEGMRSRAAALTSLTSTTHTDAVSPSPRVEDPTVTTFSASAQGISVSSPVLGVIILVISLAFFYLYLVYVYPVSELF